MSSVIPSRIAPAAAAFDWNAGSGRDTQVNIWIGIAVNGSLSHPNEMNGDSLVNGDYGKKAMQLNPPIAMIGAVSPIARDRWRFTPVRMPPVEYGKTWSFVTSQRVAPRPYAASRIAFGTERIASRVATITIGKIKSASVSPAAAMLWPRSN